jgi:hypothetical protein
MSDIPDEGRGPTTRERRHELTSQSPDDLKKRLTDEYKILQDKIDKIGAFRFTIKGWAITAVGAATAAATATKSLAVAGVVSVGLAILVVFFFKFEIEQVRLSRLFGSLAGKLSVHSTKLIPKGFGGGFGHPPSAVKSSKPERSEDSDAVLSGGWSGLLLTYSNARRGRSGGAISKRIGRFADRPISPSTYFCSS